MKSIIFNTEMVKAILDGRKNTFRLPIKKEKICEDWIMQRQSFKDTVSKYKADDILYVKETFQLGDNIRNIQNIPLNEDVEVLYYEDEINSHNSNNKDFAKIIKWKPSIHMPKKYARIFLKVINVRVERLQDMDWKDIFNEGFEAIKPIEQYQSISLRKECKNWWINLWNSTAKYGYKWEDNPYVFVYEFETINKLNI